MKQFPQGVKFCYPWRSYQREVLEHLNTHLKNNHLHLVAPPGSGKTVLGLEVMLRLNKPTLIVSPTLAIRNQWVDRFTELFLQQQEPPDWISTDVRNPAFVTVTTYQGLHALLEGKTKEKGNDSDLDDVERELNEVDICTKEKALEKLLLQNFQTLILDEAHHLRTSWWETTRWFRDQLKQPAVVALTATPPYDVSSSEWEKYLELCGPIDEEIDIAALVREGDLCPHQDYVWMSTLSQKEEGPIRAFRGEVQKVIQEVKVNKDLIHLLENHPWITSTNELEEKLAKYGYFISIILFLKDIGSDRWQLPFQQLDEKHTDLPQLTDEWMEELLSGLLYHDQHVNVKDEPLKSIRKTLSSIGALERKSVRLVATKRMQRTFMQSASKLQSITNVVSLEKDTQGNEFRLVVLADYIYKDDLPKADQDIKPMHRLGVIPIFEVLRRQLKNRCQLGVLTGSIVIIPTHAVSRLHSSDLNFSVQPLRHDPAYSEVMMTGASRQEMVKVITTLFSEGYIDTLVGTTALLGEGWDAPSVNTLVLASFVGSFMLTNQMRGRAIRSDKTNPEKCANIWHLVCVDTNTLDGGYDYSSLSRRFKSLSGLDEELPMIVSGIERLRFPHPPFSAKTAEDINSLMTKRAMKRTSLFARWQEATHLGEKKREQMDVKKHAVPRPFLFKHTLKALLITTAAMIIGIVYESAEASLYVEYDGILPTIAIAGVAGLIFSAPFWWKAVRIFVGNISIESSLQTAGQIIYDVLFEIGSIDTPPKQNKVGVNNQSNGMVCCSLEKGTPYEQKLFLQALQQFLEPIDNPRYILHRTSGGKWYARHDYHAIPDEIGRKKEYTQLFEEKWQKKLGQASAIFTRNVDGRKILLKARVKAMSGKFVKRTERKSVWK
ncbi:DEAD/DEAH box helicase family protein [Bacillaceae bacterium SIJ1]|uniref:DEAD/DEAH box helicase family protein n=1 Tax=Litoribacterium kuwaitense TaxID=1398745 RepID=UPI0013EC63BE|nr:DEAD/DEAH box helicase family protein [Litoribacterium kuwaitense]NGP45944.1 DEAD/DEAH box helicase family protein [Litoribacterium kuwaitense]